MATKPRKRAPKRQSVQERLRAHALSLPETREEFPWGDRVAKVRGKIFAFLGSVEDAESHITLKLPESREAALSIKGASPTGYGLGRAGWVTMPARGDLPPIEILIEWVEESYRAVAPKKLSAQLGERCPR